VWHSICVPENIELPDFKIPHAEKIEWMIETNGWALEPIAAMLDSDPPAPGYAYTIGLPATFSFPDIVIFGLAPVAAKGLIDLVIEQVTSGVEIPRDIPLVGLLDNELRCVFSTVDVRSGRGGKWGTCCNWYGPIAMGGYRTNQGLTRVCVSLNRLLALCRRCKGRRYGSSSNCTSDATSATFA
jgi:hypothetical protein